MEKQQDVLSETYLKKDEAEIFEERFQLMREGKRYEEIIGKPAANDQDAEQELNNTKREINKINMKESLADEAGPSGAGEAKDVLDKQVKASEHKNKSQEKKASKQQDKNNKPSDLPADESLDAAAQYKKPKGKKEKEQPWQYDTGLWKHCTYFPCTAKYTRFYSSFKSHCDQYHKKAKEPRKEQLIHVLECKGEPCKLCLKEGLKCK